LGLADEQDAVFGQTTVARVGQRSIAHHATSAMPRSSKRRASVKEK
jgi:hypothetical protein